MKNSLNRSIFILFLIPLSIFAQNNVSGTVTDTNTNMPIPGVNVILKGSTNGTTTDFDGNYTVSDIKNGDVLIFSYVGYKNNEETYNGEKTLNLSLSEDAAVLGEVLLIGYGSVNKKDATGSVTQLTAEDFNGGNIVTAENLINGRAAGVTINTSGAPGSGSTIRIRGGASLSASNDPLIVIDGLPITNDNAGGSRSILAGLNPADIESFNILKDASATAIYGSRASNGVIIINTKKGSNKTSVQYDVNFGYNTINDQISVYNAADFRKVVEQQFPAAGSSSNAALQARLGNADTNWQDEIFRDVFSVNHNLSVRGAIADVLPIRFSTGFNRQPGNIETSEFERSNFSLALNPKLFEEHLKINVNANYSREDNRFADTGQIGAAANFDPTQSVFDPTSGFGGYFQYINPDGTKIANAPGNPVASLLQRRNAGNVDRFYGNVEFDYKLHFFEDMRAVVNLGYDRSFGEGTDITDANSINGFDAGSTINDIQFNNNSSYESLRKNKNLNAYLVYNKSVGDFNLEATGGYDYQVFERNDFTTNNTNDPASNPPRLTQPIDVVLASFFGRFNIDFQKKYLLTLTYRRDGSSRFIDDFRFANFPAVGFAWKINEEFAESKTLSDLKLRLGYGITGQQEINQGALFNIYQSSISTSQNISQYIFGGTPIATALPGYRNQGIKWEETTQYNVGLDFGLFEDRITGSVDGFYKESKDLLISAPIADGANFSNQGFQNIGNLTSKGVEATLSSDIVKTEKVKWNISTNATIIDRKITKLAQGSDIEIGGRSGGTGGTIQVHREGQTPNSFYVYQQLYDTSGRPIEGAFRDLDGNGIINSNDRYIRGNPDADVTIGFRSDLRVKDFDFSFALRASVGNEVYNNVASANAYYSLINNNGFPSNIPTAVEETGFINQDAQIINSDLYVEDGSFLRMDNVTLGYTIKNAFNANANLRFYTGCQNVFVLSDYSGLDPEIPVKDGNIGIDNNIYPRPRTYLVGASLSF